MKFLREARWEEVYQEWKRSEADQEFWKKEYQRRGFKTWEEFKAVQIMLVTMLEISRWQIFEVFEEELAEFRVGAFQGWLKHAGKAGDRKFSAIAKLSELQSNTKVQDIRTHFPQETQLIGFRKNGAVILYEGHHRSTAATQLFQAGQPPRSCITIALVELDAAREYPFVDFRPHDRFHMWLWGKSTILERWYRRLRKMHFLE